MWLDCNSRGEGYFGGLFNLQKLTEESGKHKTKIENCGTSNYNYKNNNNNNNNNK
jgi:hypothetical protein